MEVLSFEDFAAAIAVKIPAVIGNGPVGGLSVDLAGDETGLPLERAQSSGGNAGLLAGIAASISAVVIAVTGAAWYARRRLIR